MRQESNVVITASQDATKISPFNMQKLILKNADIRSTYDRSKDNEWKYKSISILNQKNLNLPKDILAFTKQI